MKKKNSQIIMAVPIKGYGLRIINMAKANKILMMVVPTKENF